jgi:methionyl-tRNA formyltransferase
MKRIVFMGSPEFAVPSLEALIEAFQVIGVVTQPDRKAGRGQKKRLSDVKTAALAHNLPVHQPRTLRTPEAVEQLKNWSPDLIVVAAFGQILRQEVLDIPPHGCLNVHASLLPRWRGADPIRAAILAGVKETGVTIMKMNAGLDTGAILNREIVPITPVSTFETLSKKLAIVGAKLLTKILPAYFSGELIPAPQPDGGVTYTGKISKKAGRLDWQKSAIELDRMIRAFMPWPSTFTTLRQKRLKILQAVPLPDWRGDAPPGTIITLADGCAVATGEGALRLEMVQPAGKRPMDIASFLCGHRDCIGVCLGEPGK